MTLVLPVPPPALYGYVGREQRARAFDAFQAGLAGA
jgi:hypothetical protein